MALDHDSIDGWTGRAGRLARGRVGAAIAFISGVSEATFLPVLPEVPVALLGAAAPERTLPLALWASAGSASGGILTYVA